MTKEQEFYDALRDVFVGAEVEGESGYINLMRIKSRYFQERVFPRLQGDIEDVLDEYPEFREELFDKLYDFFHRYFSESGSIYFRRTRYPQSVYEQVYTDDKDVMLFWKTRMLYYVKTDRLFKSLEVELDDRAPSTGGSTGSPHRSGHRFFFDVFTLQHKRANEKRDLVYRFDQVRDDGTVVFKVEYSTYGSKTKMLDILRALRDANVDVGEDLLKRAFRVFEKQSEVDYFINKDAEKFLKEQFDLWMYRYLFEGQNIWIQRRLQQLQALKELAYKIIEFIAQFEDELVRVWNKPKFVRNSHYVVTLDHIAERDGDLLTRVLGHAGMEAQVAEWRELGMVGDDFAAGDVWARDLFGEQLDETYQYLPLDTRHVPDLEMDILCLFDHLDKALDGWLIKSENYQALNTLQPRFREQVKCIYIDPPYNTGNDEFVYKDRYQHSAWLTMMENRVCLSRNLMRKDGATFISIDDNEVHRLNNLLVDLYGEENSAALLIARTNPRGRTLDKYIAKTHEYVMVFVKETLPTAISEIAKGERMLAEYNKEDENGRYRELGLRNRNPMFNRKNRPNLFFPIYVNPNDSEVSLRQSSRFSEEVYPRNSQGEDDCWTWSEEKVARNLDNLVGRQVSTGAWRIFRKDYMRDEAGDIATTMAKSIWLDKSINNERGKETLKDIIGHHTIDFPKSVDLIRKCIEIGAPEDGLILDFFAGSGTTAHAVMNLNREDDGRRKYILVEMADYFDDVLLPRVKKVAFSDEWQDGVAQEGGQGMSHFVKYYELEQYEDVLRKARYGAEGEPFDNPYEDVYQQYVFLRDLKMLHALEIDHEANDVHVDLSTLYEDIDVAETLANLRGKWIARITPEFVEFEDGERIELQDLDWELIKPLIWW